VERDKNMSDTTKFTPGPWHIEKSCGRYEIWPKDEGQTHTCIGIIQTRPNADLIANATELYDVLSIMEKMLTDGDVTTNEINQARAILKKARGE
jgi:hypothetical protein